MKDSELLALRKVSKQYQTFPHTEEGATAAVGFLEGEGGAVYRLDYYEHLDGLTGGVEYLPRSTKVGET